MIGVLLPRALYKSSMGNLNSFRLCVFPLVIQNALSNKHGVDYALIQQLPNG